MSDITPVMVEGSFNSPLFHTAVTVKLSGLVFTAGLVSVDADGNVLHEGDFAGQARTTLVEIKRTLEAAGASLDRVVKLTVFVTNMDDRAAFIPIREAAFGGKIPPISMVEVSRLANPAFLIEIEAIAAI